MKLITAIIKPSELNKERAALTAVGARGTAVTEMKGYGRRLDHTEL